jgi:hypothetical protein
MAGLPAFVSYHDLQTAWFRPMGFSLRVLTNHPTIVAAAEASFGGFGPAQPVTSPDFTLRLFAHDRAENPLREPVFHAQGGRIYQTTGHASTLVADRDQGLAWGSFSPTVLARSAFFRYHFLELAFYSLLSPRGLMAVHGAACVRSGRAMLLRAPSGGGKSTLVYASIRRRFQVLAEDVVWIDITNHLWWGLPWWCHLRSDARRLFPELALLEPVLEIQGERRLAVHLETIRPGSTVVSARPGPVVLLRRSPGGPSRLTPLTCAEAKALWYERWSGTETEFADYDRYVHDLLSHHTYRLDFGDDIERSLELLESLSEV